MDATTSLDKALDLLFFLHRRPEPCGVSEAGRELGMPKSSVHRLLAVLTRRGLLERDGRGRYRSGPALIALGLGALHGDPLVALARPVLEAEVARWGETVFLATARAQVVTVLDQVEGAGVLRAAPRVGSPVPVHATAVGKLYLAFAPEAVELGPEPFEPFTPTTPRTRATLDPEVARVRALGFAENRGEWIPGLGVIAAPVAAGGRMVAALALAAPEPRMPALQAAGAAGSLVAAGRALSARLEAAPPAREASR
jgi:DNA-binding IclR family transcriptional regulator